MSAPDLLDVAAAAAAHRAATAATRVLPAVLHVGTYTSTRAADRTRPYCCTVKVGRSVRVERFGKERERDLYAAQARRDLALLADRIDGRDR